MTFLGHLVSEEGLQPDPRLLESIREIQPPTSVTQVRSFLGLVGYYQRFIKGFSKIAVPLNKLLEKNKLFVWTTECKKAFRELKELLLKEPVVACPDFSVPFWLYTCFQHRFGGHFSPETRRKREDNLLCQSDIK